MADHSRDPTIGWFCCFQFIWPAIPASVHDTVFSDWGICFSLKAKPNSIKRSESSGRFVFSINCVESPRAIRRGENGSSRR